MPDLDSGHIFLTTLAPIKPGAPADDPSSSFEQKVRIALARLPTAHQSPATDGARFNSPFARNLRNHFCRMFVLNDTVFNGRDPSNAILDTIKGINTSIPGHTDELNNAYLVFCADIDAITQDNAPLPLELEPSRQRIVRDAYARELWNTMGEELADLYGNCVGFENVSSAEDFAKYLSKCHVETTMPYHDYYLSLPKFNTLPIKALAAGVLIPLVVGLVSLVLWLFGLSVLPIVGWSSLASGLLGMIIGALALIWAISFAIKNGEKPLPPGKYDDLPSVLKAVYIQQKFADFAVRMQGASDADLHKAFGRFIAEHAPDDIDGPRQKPGVIASRTALTIHTKGQIT